MAINLMQELNKPLGTDVYNVGVFNANYSAIQNAINGTEQSEGLIPVVNSLIIDIVKKYPYFTNQTDINSVLENGVYYNIVSGSEPLENNILFSINVANNNLQTLISEGKISQRLVTTSSTNPSWTVLTTKVINNLDTGGTDNALSAEQGKILNKTKLDHFKEEDTILDLDSLSEGIYCCSAGTKATSTSIPINDTNAVVLQFGDGINVSSIQLFYGVDNSATYIRYRAVSENWSGWLAVGGGTVGVPILLETVADYPRV